MNEIIVCALCSKETPHRNVCSLCYSEISKEMKELRSETEDLRRYENEQYSRFDQRPSLVLIKEDM